MWPEMQEESRASGAMQVCACPFVSGTAQQLPPARSGPRRHLLTVQQHTEGILLSLNYDRCAGMFIVLAEFVESEGVAYLQKCRSGRTLVAVLPGVRR